MKPSYPTITFPNHYTIVTGMNPPAHGIMANKFYSPEFKTQFRIGRPESFKLRWWGGEPVWKTVERQGKKAATFFWPGSEVDGNHPTYWYYYNESLSFEYRVDKVLSWLELPPESRPEFITLYMHEPDNMGHDFGPHSPELEKMLVRVDLMVKRLVEGLQARNLLSCVNMMLIADHGMAEAGQDKAINLNDYIPNITNRTRFWNGPFSRFTPLDGKVATKRSMMQALACKRPELRVYEKQLLPIRWHMGTQSRVEDIVLDLDPGFTIAGDASYKADAGEHGYDNYFPVMNALFVAHGPDFRRNTEVEAFQNIELYNLMCLLMGVKPAPNNGTWGALHHMLVNPPLSPLPPYQVLPPIAQLPTKEELLFRLSEAQCSGDQFESENLFEVLEEAQENMPNIMAEHLPWGVPQSQHSSILLIQPDYITAYAPHVRLPLWTSFTVSSIHETNRYPPWRSDVRLTPEQTANCPSYDSVTSYNITRQPLFPCEFTSRMDYNQLPYLISNAVPFSNQLTQRWQELKGFINKWMVLYGPLNIVTGPVFDYNADTFADDLTTFSQSGGLVVPTHMFLVVSRCLVLVNHMADCPHTQVDALAFVYPQYLSITNCLNPARYAQEFSAKVQDVEKITGLKLYPSMHYDDQVRLQVRIHSNIWGYESSWNRLRNNVYDLGK
ncbi:Venom phosphodiesterase 2-like 1 [Homarus americanus]|uniref:Venom phosphodiesterase 2-like 1 n=2 Tax=Homarus americanus TaxID=6706 RepID=A0A8J5NEH7_HOMAM|nr:Venom phosphodiesterase 2-like 1 [Homarus americanus]